MHIRIAAMRYKRMKVEGASYFFTLVTHERRKLFAERECVALFESAVSRIRERHPFEVEALVVLPDHLHTLWQLPPGTADYSTRWRLIKEAFTKAYLKRYPPPNVNPSRRARGEQSLWQRRFWEHLVRDDRDFGDHLDYIHLNPVRQGFVSSPSEWPHSSFSKWVERGVYEPHWGSGEKAELPEWAKAFE